MGRRTGIAIASIVMAVLFLSALLQSGGDHLGIDNRSAQNQISGWVPVGLPIEKAKQMLEEHHFAVTSPRPLQDGYSYRTPYYRGEGVQKDLRFPPRTELITCFRAEGHWYTSRRVWQIDLFILDGKVTHLFVQAGTQGLG